MKKNCEQCGVSLGNESENAVICSYECTYCADCAEKNNQACPKCDRVLRQRPTRRAVVEPQAKS
ncbi:MAG TPA: DUF1272 domain-containing protein [Verrucomicrobiae bacterium]